MYNKKNQGHGICGSRNIYSSRVHLDNWIEDTVAQNLISQPRTGGVLYQTNTASCFTHPSERPEPPPMPANIPSTLELKTKNKEGMSYSLLFEHNIKPSEAEARFTSNMKLTIMSRPEIQQFNTMENHLSKQKSKQMVDDINRSYVKVSQSKFANAHLKFQPSSTVIPYEQTADLPDFRRRNNISRQFVPGI